MGEPQSDPHGPAWRWHWLFFWHALAAVAAISWLAWPTRVLWQTLDEVAAVGLNSLLALGPRWAEFWAFANTRRFDLIAAGLMIGLLALYVSRSRGNAQLGRRLAEASFIGLYLLGVVGLFREVIFTEWVFDPRRHSPMLAVEEGRLLRMSELAPQIKAKEQSSSAFPGDHAIVVGTFVALFWFFAGRGFGLAAAVMGVLFVLPRLVGGAHWVTDVVIGGFGIAMISVAWAMCTPLHRYAVGGLERLIHGVGDGAYRVVKACRADGGRS